MSNWRQDKRGKGWKDLLVWLNPLSTKIIGEIKSETEESNNEIINRIIYEWYYGETKTDMSEDTSEGKSTNISDYESYISDLYNQLNEVRQRIDKIEDSKSVSNINTTTSSNITTESNEEEYREIIKQIVKPMREAGNTYQYIADYLNNNNYLSMSNRRWSVDAVRKFVATHIK